MNTMTKKSRLALAIGLTGAVGLGAGSAMATDFQASVEIQNNIEVVNDGDLDFGVISLRNAEQGEIGGIQLLPDGNLARDSSKDEVAMTVIQSEGPAQGSVAASSDFTLSFPADSWTEDYVDDQGIFEIDDPMNNIPGGAVVLSNNDFDSDAPDLYLFNFQVAADDGGADQDTAAQHQWDMSPDGDEINFTIGGTLTTDNDDAGEYDEGIYDGTFEVTAEF